MDAINNESRFRESMEQAPVGIAIFRTRDMVVEMANGMYLELISRPVEEVVGRSLYDVLPGVRELIKPLLDNVWDTANPYYDNEFPITLIRHGVPELMYFNFVYQPLKNTDGEINGVMVVATDVTAAVATKHTLIAERKEQEMALRLSEEKFRVLGETLPQMIWTTDGEGRLNYASRKYFEFTGMTLNELNGAGWFNVIHPEDLVKNLPVWREAVTKGVEYQFEHRMRKADGTYRWHLTRTVPQKDAEGHVKMWVGSTTDIHEGKMFIDKLEAEVQERTKELLRSNDDLRNSNEELAQFAYVASHDLQEPLRKIQTFASRLLDTEFNNISDKGKDYLGRMQAAAQRMRQLIEDLLTFSRASNNGDQLFEYVDLTLVLTRVKELLSDQIDKKEALIVYDLLPVLSAIPYQIEQLFTNLLINALKFSRKGVKPVIQVKMEDNVYTLVGGLPYHKITIADNGIGFDPQFSERIFQVFQRLHVRNQFEGTGIGLAICKKIMDNHKGVIMAEGKPGEGSVFTLLFPVG